MALRTRTGRLVVLVGVWLLGTQSLPAEELAQAGLHQHLPAATLAYVRIPDCGLLQDRLGQSAVGRMAGDAEIGPFIQSLAEGALDYEFPASRLARERGETSAWRSSITGNYGELVLAMVARPAAEPVSLLAVAAGPEQQLVASLAEAYLHGAQSRGGRLARERLARGSLAVVTRKLDDTPLAAVLEREGIFAFCDDPEVLRAYLAAWEGRRAPSIQSNPDNDSSEADFSVNMTSFVEQHPFRDHEPPAAVKAPPSRMSGPVLRGQVHVAREPFDLRIDAQLDCGHARPNQLRWLGLTGGETTAEPWVPRQAAVYGTVNWDWPQLRSQLAERAEASAHADRRLVTLAEESGMLMPPQLEVLLPHLSGRVSHARWFTGAADDDPLACELLGLRLKHIPDATAALDEIVRKAGTGARRVEQKGQAYFEVDVRPRLCVCLLDDYLIVGNCSRAILDAKTASRQPEGRLCEELDYRLVASRMLSLAQERPVAGAAFARPTAFVGSWHGRVERTLDRGLTGEMLADPVQRVIFNSLDRHPLPELARLNRYFAPAGGVLFLDGDSVHLSLALLRRRLPN